MPSRRLDAEDAATLMPLGADAPTALRFTADGRSLLYLRPEPGSTVQSLWLHPLDGSPRRILSGESDPARYDLAEELRRERQRMVGDGVTEFAIAGAAIVARAGGRLLRGGLEGTFAPWPGAEGAEAHLLLPDGQGLVVVRHGDVWRLDAEGGERRLTHDAGDGVTSGLAEFAAAEELDRHSGMWLSPDGRSLAFARVDARAIAPHTIVHASADLPWLETIRYPFAGGPNAEVRLGVLDIGGDDAPTAWLGQFEDEYLARVAWTPTGDLLCLVYSRDQHRAEWRRYVGGAGDPVVFGREGGEHWLSLPAGLVPLDDGGLLTTRERDGHSHLVRYGTDGGETLLTAGDWDITGIYGMDAGKGALVQRTDRLGLERKVSRVAPDGAVIDLTAERGVHQAVWTPAFDRFVRLSQSLSSPTSAVVCDAAGREETVVHQPDAGAEALGLLPPELVDITAEDGTVLHGAIYRPADDGRPHAAVVDVYGGPHAQRVRDEWSLTVDLRCQYLAQQGVVVFKLDNRGSDGRGTAFARAVEHGFATVEVRDQAKGVRHLVAHEGVDPHRVGIYGWSYGGFMTLHALLQAPEVFRVGVAGAPVTDFARYDTAYTERHMGTPDAYPEAYRHADVLARVGVLTGDLLVIHGLVDENVHFAHTARLVDALIAAGKPFDLALLPTSRHKTRDLATRRYIERRTTAWLLDRLR